VQFSKRVTAINPNKITVLTSNFKSEQIYWQAAWQRFREMQFRKLPNDDDDDDGVKLSAGQSVLVAIIAESDEMTFNYDTFEGYKLMIFEGASDEVHVYISARNFYGTRHALETLSQLIVFDEHENALVILAQAEISDEPKFKHRGFSMDTSRTFFPVDVLKRTINGLAMVKLNTFHWHITDAQSFPFEVKSRPELAKYGAYSPDKVYTASDVRDVVEYARARGVRVIPELDAPAHMGEGWKESGLTKCYKDPELRAQWRGQIDPTNDEVYEILADVYREMVDAFEPTFFHMGGDEVNITCWNTSATITEWMTARGMDRTVDGFMQLWIHFQRNALEKLDSVSDRELPLILWTSSLTKEPYLSQIVDKDRYVIQLWTYSNDASIKPILEAGYKVIISNSDVLYLDCGLGWWVRDGLNWCQPHKSKTLEFI
jgi:hexosaminidase